VDRPRVPLPNVFHVLASQPDEGDVLGRAQDRGLVGRTRS
jgi:hypothetical protein